MKRRYEKDPYPCYLDYLKSKDKTKYIGLCKIIQKNLKGTKK